MRLGKGKKDRMVVLPPKTLRILEDYWRGYKTKEYIFEGQKGGRYSPESFSQILKQGIKRVGISKGVSLHTLPHSYTTHLHEQGTDIFVIQKLLGHHSSKTTEIYTHISKKHFIMFRIRLRTWIFEPRAKNAESLTITPLPECYM
ncbi:MAG: tyrosine-type recombinase/integrase [Bacteroidia bacterium]